MSSDSIKQIIDHLDFQTVMRLSWRMLFNDYFNEEQSEFGVNLLLSLREVRKKEWESDWRNDAVLGVACDSTYREEERYYAFQRAYDKALQVGEGDHPGLLIALARCSRMPGKPLISAQEALQLIKKALKERIFLDGAWAMSGVYSLLEEDDLQKKWKTVAEKLEEEGAPLSPHIYPQYLWDLEIA